MTRASYDECRKVMQQIRGLLMEINKANGEVAKWSNIESGAREKNMYGQAEGAAKKLTTALIHLEKLKKKFADIKFPDSNLKEMPEQTLCKLCNAPAPRGSKYCGECETTIGENNLSFLK